MQQHRDLYQQVTNRIIEALEAGTPPWVRPWSVHADALPANAVSRGPYRDVSALYSSRSPPRPVGTPAMPG